LVEKFEQDSNYKASVGGNGTSSGYKKFVIRQAEIWNASRPIVRKEVDELKEKGIGWIELTVAVDGIVIAVNGANDWCSELTVAQLSQIWESESKIKKWSDLNPAWPAEEIKLFGADVDSGTFEYFTEAINGKKGSINTRYTPSANDNVLVEGISTNKYALGFVPFGYYIEKTESLKPLGVSPTRIADEKPAPYVLPSVETIVTEEYKPLARPLFMYVNTDALQHRPEVAAFMRLVVSEEAQPLIEKRGFVRVKDDVRQKMAAKLEEALAGQSVTKN
jgi:phosphate transport system substrate-binding protein